MTGYSGSRSQLSFVSEWGSCSGNPGERRHPRISGCIYYARGNFIFDQSRATISTAVISSDLCLIWWLEIAKLPRAHGGQLQDKYSSQSLEILATCLGVLLSPCTTSFPSIIEFTVLYDRCFERSNTLFVDVMGSLTIGGLGRYNHQNLHSELLRGDAR